MNDKQITVSASACQDEIKLTELTTLKASYEFLRKRHRGNQKLLEKELQTMTRAIDDYKKANCVMTARESLGEFLEDVSRLKRKAESIVAEETAYTKTCKVRLNHLLSLSTEPQKSTEMEPPRHWSPQLHQHRDSSVFSASQTGDSAAAAGGGERQRLHRHLADHLFAQGCCRTAMRLGHTSLSPSTGNSGTDGGSSVALVEVYREALDVIAALKEGQVAPIEAWLAATQYRYKKTEDSKMSLRTDLNIFKLYLLIKVGSWQEALRFANSFCDPATIKPETMEKLSRVMTLMIYRNYDDMVTAAKEWEVDEGWMVRQFHSFILNFYSFYRDPTVLSLVINTGITVRKTEDCYRVGSKKPHCVVCMEPVNSISVRMPTARHEHSVLICWKTGLRMDEHNPPIAFPNGYVYCTRAIPELLQGDEVVCPRSGSRCKEADLQRVYIL